MAYMIKWRFVLKFTVVLFLAAISLHFIHRWQVRSQAGAFLHQADLARVAAKQAEERDPPEPQVAREQREREQSFLQRYILARPNDIDVRERFARLMAQNAKTGREAVNAYFVLEDVLRRDPSRHELRRFAAEYALSRLGFVKEAEENLNYLLNTDDFRQDGAIRGMYARCLALESKFEESSSEYRRSIGQWYSIFGIPLEDRNKVSNPGTIQPASFYGFALVLRKQNRDKEADILVHRMLRGHSADPASYLLALSYLHEFGLETLPEIEDYPARSRGSLVSDAYRIAPKDLYVLIAAADLARSQSRKWGRTQNYLMKAAGKLRELDARDRLRTAILEHPSTESAYLAMASLEAEDRLLDDAIKVVRDGLAKEELKDSMKLIRRLLEYQVRTGDKEGAEDTLKELQARGLEPGLDEFETARVMMIDDKWKEAAAALERAIPQLQDDPSLVREAHLLLGRCYEQLGEPERRLRAYTLALPNEVATPLWATAMIGIAESETALGRIDDALKTYRKVVDWFPGMSVPIAKLELVRALRQPDGERSWAHVDAALTAADEAAKREGGRFVPDNTDLTILHATVKHYKGRPEQARAELEKLRHEKPKNIAVRIELGMQELREIAPSSMWRAVKLAEALSKLSTAEKEIGDSVDLRLARARVLAAMKGPNLAGNNAPGFSAKYDELAKSDFPIAQKRRLLRGLAEIASASGADEAASRLWNELATAKPFDLSVHLIRFERALRAGDLEAMRAIVPKINQLDGENGRSARLARATLLLHESMNPNKSELLDQALRLLDAIEQQGSPSGRVFLLQGLSHEMKGSNESKEIAKTKYRQAIERGELNPEAVRRLVGLLIENRDDEEIKEAQALIAKIENTPNLGPDFQRLAASVSLRANDIAGATAHAEKAISPDSKNYKDQIALGRLYWLSKKPGTEPLKHFQAATALAPDAMETWLSLIQYLLATGNKEKATGEYKQALEKVKPADRSLFAALGYAQLGDTKKAIETLEQARKANSTDVRILSAEANLLFQTGHLKEARDGFERVLAAPSATDGEKAAARQNLALATAADNDFKTASKALTITPLTGKETPAQLRAHAVILGLQKSIGHRREAIRLLEQNRKGSSVGERFLLAQLHNLVGNRTGVPLVMEEILQNENNRTPLHLRFYARWLIREGQLSRASNWIDVLAKKDPDALATAELEARLAAARKDLRGAWEALRLMAEKPDALAVIARICEDIGLHEEAEHLIKRFVELNKQANPRSILGLAAFYGRRGRTAEGLKICEEMRGKLPLAMVAEAAIGVLYNAQTPSSADMEKIAGWLDGDPQMAMKPRPAPLLQLLAAIRNLQGQYDDSANIYKEILRENPNDALALNNLAYLISAIDKRDADMQKRLPNPRIQTEGLAMIGQAKQIIGPLSVLLDTEALILLNAGQANEALKLMVDVVAQAPSGSAYFHLAQVEDKRNPNSIEARVAWRQAKELGLKPGDLHPLERPAYQDLVMRLN